MILRFVDRNTRGQYLAKRVKECDHLLATDLRPENRLIIESMREDYLQDVLDFITRKDDADVASCC